eukprot:Partr_v1_DN29026_c1_g3_i3_m58723 putative gamma adaptin ear containing, arf binding protein
MKLLVHLFMILQVNRFINVFWAIEKATSEMIPSGQEDISLFLEICDRVRGKEIAAKDAMRALKKRLLHRNPNVQLLALKLTDICVKNAGSLFLAEVASREFMDTLVQIVSSDTTNIEVKNKILGHIQSWSSAFKSKPNLSYAVDTYNQLKSQGIHSSLNSLLFNCFARPPISGICGKD